MELVKGILVQLENEGNDFQDLLDDVVVSVVGEGSNLGKEGKD